MAYQGTYTFIPPPPLPEFYQQRDTASTSSSASVEEDAQVGAPKNTPICIDGAYDGRMRDATKLRAAPTPLMAILPTRPFPHVGEVPPLAIYHICRVCLRPRSPRYHREHRIPIDGLPPPPGVCRRCRVTSVEDIKRVADVVRIGESNEIKIGFITPFVPDDAIISNEEMRAMNVDRYLRTSSVKCVPSQPRHQSRKDIAHRHVKIVDEAEDAVPTRRTKVKFISRDDTENTSEGSAPEIPLAPVATSRSMQVQPTENPLSIQANATEDSAALSKDSSKFSASKTSTSTRTTTSSSATVKGSAIVSKILPRCTGSEIRQIAREEVERYRDAYWIAQRSDSNIRRIAREEVERYREAERKLEAHPDPYAHGRMVPVERRIEQERDIPSPQPWIQVTENKNGNVSSTSRARTRKDYQSPRTGEDCARQYGKAMKAPQLPKTFLEHQQEFPRHRDQSRERHEGPDYETGRQRQTPLPEGDPTRGSRSMEAGAVKVIRKEPVRRYSIVETAKDTALSVNSRSVESQNFDSSEGPNTHLVENSSKPNSCESRRTGPSEEDSRPGRKHARRTVEDATIRKGEHPARPEFDTNYARTEWPVETPTEQSSRSMPSRSRRSDRNSDIEYLYAERIVQPAHRPPRRRPFDDHPPTRYVEVEDVIETRRRSAPPAKSARQGFRKERKLPATSIEAPASTKVSFREDEEKHYCRYEESREQAHSSTEPEVNVSILAAAKHDDRIPSHQKTVVDVEERVKRPPRKDSPTPQQQSHSPSNYWNPDTGDSNHVRFSGKVDVSPTPPDSDAGSSEFRAFPSSGWKSPSQVHGSQSSHRSQFSLRESERTDRKHHSKVNTKDSAGRERRDGADSRAGNEQNRKLSGAGGRPLGHALSESPSREESTSSLRIDGRGPYRVREKVTDSMRVEDGSPGTRVWDEREGTRYTRRGDAQKGRQRQHN